MGNYTTRINWTPPQDSKLIQEGIRNVCQRYNMHCVKWPDGVNVIAEDTILSQNGVILNDMGNCVEDIETLLKIHKVDYRTEDTKWWWNKV